MIALAGPAVNFAIAAALTPLVILGAGEPGSASAPGLFLDVLLQINLVLGLFNLIPAFPMDGGRVLRALLSSWLGRARATTVASRLGRFLALLFGALAVWTLNPIHLALAAFIYFAARAEEAQVLFEERERGSGVDSQGIWTAPPGYRWVSRGNGIWQLAPTVTVGFGDSTRNASPWR